MTDEKPTTEERYTTATHAKSLVVNPDSGGAADMLIAAGWSKNRLGAALMRLASEWDGAQKPQALSPQAIAAVAKRLAGAASPTPEHHRQARKQAADWLLHEQKILMGHLKTLPEVRAYLTEYAAAKGYSKPADLVMGSLMWWLDPVCRVCHGKRWEVIKDTGRLSDRVCPACRGSGRRDKGMRIESESIIGYFDDCVRTARTMMRKKLRQYPHHSEVLK